MSDKVQKQLDRLFEKFAQACANESTSRLEQGKWLMKIQELCQKNHYSFRYHCRLNRVEHKKALALIAIYKAFKAKTLTIGKIHDLGWTKLMLIAPKLGQGMDDYWISTAVTTTILTLKVIVSDSKAAGVSSVTFHLTDTERAEMNAVLIKFGARQNTRGLDKRDFAFMSMVRAAARNVKTPLKLVA